VDINWKVGSGANSEDWKQHTKFELDPYGPGRSPIDNYKMLISAITPRPIGFISTISGDGVRNLAPFSYFTFVNHDPPIFVIGFSKGSGKPKDTEANILETGELTVNIISEWFVEAANYTSINAPLAVDEWKASGLTPLPSTKVRPPHVAESAFSVEGKLIHSHEWISKISGNPSGTLCIVEGINFHIREDVINDAKNLIDPEKLRPVSRLGGITYGRTTAGFEMPRPDFDTENAKIEFRKAQVEER
jgi:flavin reductase (DIM6/NTAB) family NADH-FMN oxidoreductase RutF